jgi:SAM-dependent methyltransferase
MNTAAPYLFDNAQSESAQRMRLLARMFDAPTQRALLATGLTTGWECLEVGGGGGSIATWLAEQVAPAGAVLCTDIDPRHVTAATPLNLHVLRHDIVRDELPAARFDLVHARLVLIHIPERAAVLEKLVTALKPGGWLVIEDFDTLSMPPDPAVSPAESRLDAFDALRAYFARGGADSRFGRTLYGRFRGLGLKSVTAEGRVLMFDGRNDGAALMKLNFEQVAAGLVGGGFISEDQLRADIARLGADDYAAPSPIMWTVAGRKPVPASSSQQG